MRTRGDSVRRARRGFKAAVIAMAVLAAAGCVRQLQPAIEMPSTFVTFSTGVNAAGKIEPPTPQRSVTMTTKFILDVTLDEYSGFTWQITKAPSSAMFSFLTIDGSQCQSGCVITQGVEYAANATGRTTMTLALVATADGSASASPSPTTWPSTLPSATPPYGSAGGPSCPAGITAPPPSADVGCVLGRVTVTITVH